MTRTLVRTFVRTVVRTFVRTPVSGLHPADTIAMPYHNAVNVEGRIDMAKYGKKAQKKVEKVMRERKHGTLRSGSSGKKVRSRKQAIAIGLSEARRSGAKVPARKRSSRSRSKTSSRKK